jgi:hypothetical protein
LNHAVFHTFDKVDTVVKFREVENPSLVWELECKSPKGNRCPDFGFCKWTIRLDMMEDYAVSQVPQGYLIQQDQLHITPT